MYMYIKEPMNVISVSIITNLDFKGSIESHPKVTVLNVL